MVDYSLFIPYIFGLSSTLLTFFLMKKKSNAEINKVISETDLLHEQKYKLELESTLAFRNLLLSENDSLRKELLEVKTELSELKKMFKQNLCQNTSTCKNRS